MSRLLFSLNDICALHESLSNFSEENILKVLLYGEEDLTSQMNYESLKCTIKFIKKTERFSCRRIICYILFSFSLSLTKYLLYNVFYIYFVFYLFREFAVRGVSLT